MPGVKRFDMGATRLPDISPLSKKQSSKLEKKIIDEGRISLALAKRTWYYLELI